MRLFIALPVPPDVRRSLALAQEMLKTVSKGGRHVPFENFHITLHFIGESDELFDAAKACDEASRGIRPMLLRLGEFGRFSKGGSYTAYMGITGELDELYRLHETLVSSLRDRGFALSGGNKRLTPHITLARGVTPAEDDSLGDDGFHKLALGANSAFTANQMFLYESRNEGGRMVYTPIHRVRLG